VLAVSAAFAVNVTAVVDSLHPTLEINPVPLNCTLNTQFAWLVCVFGKLNVPSVPVAGPVPVVNVAVPLAPSQIWLAAQTIVAPLPAAEPAAIVIVPDPRTNLPERNPFAVTFPLPVTVNSAVA
jgi:hypothetical protein